MSHFKMIPAVATALLLLGSAVLPSTASASARNTSDSEAAARTALVDVSVDWMQSAYYGCNPPRHSEKAYQRGDAFAPTAAVATTVGDSGRIVVLATTIYNRNPQGSAQYAVVGADGRTLRSGTTAMPGAVVLDGFAPGTRVFIRPETIGTMAKILTPEQIATCGVSMPGA